MEKYLEAGFRMMLAGAPPDLIYDEMQSQGVDTHTALHRIVDLYDHSRRSKHLSDMSREYMMWMACVRRCLDKSVGEVAVDEISGPIEPERFFEQYYTANKPLVFRAIVDYWRAFDGLTYEMLVERYGDSMVEVTQGRLDDRDHEIHPERYREKVRLEEFIEFAKTQVTNERYLVAQNRALQNVMDDLKERIDPLPGIVESNTDGDAYLWIGPQGTITHLHYDRVNVLHVVVRGAKKFILTPPDDGAFVYNHIGVFSEVDAVNTDVTRHPLYASARKLEVTVSEGDAIFIPVGWWHYVEGLSPTLAVSWSSFARPNVYPWSSP